MSKVCFDVIIPTYNRASFLERAIESVLNQNYQFFKLYVIDDGSTDKTKELVEKYTKDERFHYLYQENKGVSAARNAGIKNSHSPWISFLDSDDEWLEHKLSAQEKQINENPEFNFFHSNEIWIRNNKRINAPLRFDKSNHQIFNRSLETCLISPSTVSLKRSLIYKFNLFDESLPTCEDYDLWNKILLDETIFFSEEFLIKKYHGHDFQLSAMDPLMDYNRILSLFNLLEYFKKTPTQDELIKSVLEKKISLIKPGLEKYNEVLKLEVINQKQRDLLI